TGLRIVFVGFNLDVPPMDDLRIRRAVAHAIDVDGILEHVVEGAAAEATGYISPGVFGYADTNLRDKYRYDPDEARRLLQEAGYDGTPIKFRGYRGRTLKDGEIIEAVQAQLAEV